jgi:hypothetical protein
MFFWLPVGPAVSPMTAAVTVDPRQRSCRPLAVLQGPHYLVPRLNRPGAKVSQGLRGSFWLQGMMAGFPSCPGDGLSLGLGSSRLASYQYVPHP